MAHHSMFEPEDQGILRDMYGGEAEFLQEQKEEELEHHASRSGACRKTFGREADRLGKHSSPEGWSARRNPAAPAAESEALAGVQQSRHGWDISRRAGSWVLALCIAASAVMVIAGGILYDERSLSANFPDEYTQAAERFNRQYQFARTQEFSQENHLDSYDDYTAPYHPLLEEAEWEQQISDVLSGMLSLEQYIQAGRLEDAEYEAETLARDIRYLLRPQDHAPEASTEVKQRGVDAAMVLITFFAPDEAEMLSSALMGDDYDQELAAEGYLEQRIKECVYAGLQESGAWAETNFGDVAAEGSVLGWMS